jgi:hypothetical protein
MRAPVVIPQGCPDTVWDVAEGSTFYLVPSASLDDVGGAWMRLSYAGGSPLGDIFGTLVGCVRLSDGMVRGWEPGTPCRIVALDAETSDEDW